MREDWLDRWGLEILILRIFLVSTKLFQLTSQDRVVLRHDGFSVGTVTEACYTLHLELAKLPLLPLSLSLSPLNSCHHSAVSVNSLINKKKKIYILV